jgi:hypothetical protein
MRHSPASKAPGAWQQWQRSAFARVRSGVRSTTTFGLTKRFFRTGANARERPRRFDKLGVTGSSPVPPTSESPANAGLCRSGGAHWGPQTAIVERIGKPDSLPQ